MISQERDRVSRQPDTVEIKLSDLKKELLDKAWYDYCITNRLIAYGEVPELTEEQIEAHCREQYKKDCEKIRSRDMGGKGSGRPIKHKTEEERRQAILESKRKYNKAHREERIAYMKRWRKSKE